MVDANASHAAAVDRHMRDAARRYVLASRAEDPIKAALIYHGVEPFRSKAREARIKAREANFLVRFDNGTYWAPRWQRPFDVASAEPVTRSIAEDICRSHPGQGGVVIEKGNLRHG